MPIWELLIFMIVCFIPGKLGTIGIDIGFIIFIIQYHFKIEHLNNAYSRREYEYGQALFVICIFGNTIPEAYLGYSSAIGNDISIGVVVLGVIGYMFILHLTRNYIEKHNNHKKHDNH